MSNYNNNNYVKNYNADMKNEEQNINSVVFSNKKYLEFDDSSYFRFKITYSLLTMTPIEIKNINTDDIDIGLKPFQLNFLELVSEITNGSHFKINQTGTNLKFIPGTITNNHGEYFNFKVHESRALSYYLEGIFMISIYGKEKLNCGLNGVTNNHTDMSVDCFKAGIESIIGKLVVGDEGNKFEIISRSFYPNNTTGFVKFIFPIIRFIEPFDFTNIGKIKKVRGHCFTNNCSNFSHKIIDTLRVNFNKLLNEVWIDKNTNVEKGGLPGYGLSIFCQTTEGFVFTADKSYFSLSKNTKNDDLYGGLKNFNENNTSKTKSAFDDDDKESPEDLADDVCGKVLEEVMNVSFIVIIINYYKLCYYIKYKKYILMFQKNRTQVSTLISKL
jgi:18S rRNA biogenesis protein RCL1